MVKIYDIFTKLKNTIRVISGLVVAAYILTILASSFNTAMAQNDIDFTQMMDDVMGYTDNPSKSTGKRLDEIMDPGMISALTDSKYRSYKNYVSWYSDLDTQLKNNPLDAIDNTVSTSFFGTKIGMDSNSKNMVDKLSGILEKMKDDGLITEQQKTAEIARIRGRLSAAGAKAEEIIDKSDMSEEDKAEAKEDIKSGLKDITTDCAPQRYYSEMAGKCFLCDLFKIAFNTASFMARQAMDSLSGSVFIVVIMGTAIWMAITVLGFVSAVENKDTKELARTLMNQFFIVMLVLVLLQTGGQSFFKMALEPIFNTGMALAQKTVGGAGCTNDYGIITEENGGGLPTSMGNNILCTMTVIQDKVAKVKALGSASICWSWEERSFIFPQLGYLITGIGLWLGAMIMIVAFPFIMIDCVLQMSVAAALLPAAIGAYAFKMTRKYTKKIWDIFMNSMFNFIFLSIITLMLTMAFTQLLLDTTAGDLDQLIASGSGAASEILLKSIGWGGMAFLKVVFVLLLTWAVLGEVGEFAGEFSSSMANPKMGSKVGGMIGSAIKATTLGLGERSAEAAFEKVKIGSKQVRKGSFHAMKKVWRSVRTRNLRGKAQKQALAKNEAFDPNNFTVESKSRFKRRNVTTEVSVGADGNQVTRRVKQISATQRSVTTTDKYFTVVGTETAVRNEKGNLQTDAKGLPVYAKSSEKIRINSSTMDDMVKKDGRVSVNAVKEIMTNSSHSQEQVATALTKQLIKERMPHGIERQTNFTSQNVKINKDDKGQTKGFEVTEIRADGSRSVYMLDFGRDGRMMTSVINYDKKGKGKMLASDGVISKKQTFKHENGTVDKSSLKSTMSIDRRHEKRLTAAKLSRLLGESIFSEEERNEAYQQILYESETNRNINYEFR